MVEKTSLHTWTCPYARSRPENSLFTTVRLDRLHELLGFDFFELQPRRKPLRVVLVLKVVHALRAAGSIGHFFVRECGLNSEGLGKFPVTR